jgi:hypothetical protein
MCYIYVHLFPHAIKTLALRHLHPWPLYLNLMEGTARHYQVFSKEERDSWGFKLTSLRNAI